MTKISPLVSVNMVAFNAADHIESTLQSVLAQTHDALEITVMDNCSEDDTADIVNRIAKTDPRVTYIRHAVNLGSVNNQTRMFQIGAAPFILAKSADDTIDPKYVERLLDLMLQDDRTVLTYAKANVVDGHGKQIDAYPDACWFRTDPDDPFESACTVMGAYGAGTPFWGLYRRSALDRARFGAWHHGLDHILLCELSLYGGIDFVDEMLFHRLNGARDYKQNALMSTEDFNRGLPSTGPFSQQYYLMPFISMCYGHMEMFARARVDDALKPKLCVAARQILTRRFGHLMETEISAFTNGVAKFFAEQEAELFRWTPIERNFLMSTLIKDIQNALLVAPNRQELIALQVFLLARVRAATSDYSSSGRSAKRTS